MLRGGAGRHGRYDPFYYDTSYGRWRENEMPPAPLEPLAVPEGTVQPGGELSGFLYFEDLSGEVSRVRFQMEVVDARTGEPLGTVEIPFLVREG
jgi:hypothetical protein